MMCSVFLRANLEHISINTFNVSERFTVVLVPTRSEVVEKMRTGGGDDRQVGR